MARGLLGQCGGCWGPPSPSSCVCRHWVREMVVGDSGRVSVCPLTLVAGSGARGFCSGMFQILQPLLGVPVGVVRPG